MKKIFFNDSLGLTECVLQGTVTQYRKIMDIQPPFPFHDIAFPNITERSFDGRFCWVDLDRKCVHSRWVKPPYKESEIVAIAQNYMDAGYKLGSYEDDPSKFFLFKELDSKLEIPIKSSSGWYSKLFGRADLMPHRILITRLHIQRMDNITSDECLMSGIFEDEDFENNKFYSFFSSPDKFDTPRSAYANMIDRMYGTGTWKKNLWCWVFNFKLIK